MAETFTVKTDEGVQALDPQQILAVLGGRGVVSGGGVHDGTDPFSLDVFATQAFFAATDTHPATTVSRSAASIDLQDYIEPFAPKKVVISVPRETNGNAAGGDYHVIEGETAQPEPSGALGRNTAKPSLPDLAEGGSGDLGGIVPEDLVPLAAAYLDAGASEIDGDDPQMVWDRRQPVDVKFRRVEANRITAVEIEDGSGTLHDGELADAADVRTDSQIIGVVNDDPDHGSRDTGVGASHEYRTDSEIRNVVSSGIDAAELQGAAGTDGQVLFTDGTNTNWASPPASWGDPFDQTLNTGDSPTLAGLSVGTLEIVDSYEWPDDTTGSTSPSAEAGGVSVLSDLGDVQEGEFADRPAASGSGDFYFAYESGIYYDRPTNDPAQWEAIAKHPLMIQSASELGFDVATQDELDTHAGTPDAHHTRYDEAVQDIESHADPLAIDITGDAGTLDDLDSSQLARSDVDDDIAGIRTHKEPSQSIHGERSDGEIERWVGDTTDVVQVVRGGTHELLRNAYYDGADYRYLVSNEGATRQEMAASGGHELATASSGLSDEVITWQTATISGGSIDTADTATNLSGGTSEWKIQNGAVVNGGHSDFTSAQDAIDWAGNNGYMEVEFPPGDHNAIKITTPGLTIRGTGNPMYNGDKTSFSSSVTFPVEIAADAVTVENIEAQASSGGRHAIRTDNGKTRVLDCSVPQSAESGIVFASNAFRGLVRGCAVYQPNIAGSGVFLNGASQITVDGNIDIRDIRNEGTNNTIGDN